MSRAQRKGRKSKHPKSESSMFIVSILVGLFPLLPFSFQFPSASRFSFPFFEEPDAPTVNSSTSSTVSSISGLASAFKLHLSHHLWSSLLELFLPLGRSGLPSWGSKPFRSASAVLLASRHPSAELKVCGVWLNFLSCLWDSDGRSIHVSVLAEKWR